MSLEEHAAEIERRLRIVIRLLESARKVYEEDPSDVNEAALKAAERLCEEEVAIAEEFNV